MFHRISKPHKLSAPRFLKLARQLHHYDGAFSHALQIEHLKTKPGAVMAPVNHPVETHSPAVLAKMSDSDKFPGIEYDE